MKKTYIKPEVNIFDVELNSIIATSLGLHDTEIDTSSTGVQLGREDNDFSAPNVWDQGW